MVNDQGQGTGGGKISPEDRAALERRVADLDGKLGKVKTEQAGRKAAHDVQAGSGRGMAYGMRMASELVGAVVVGGLIGYALDHWLGTTPWLFLVFFTLGFVAGIMNVLRGYNRLQSEIAAQTKGKIGGRAPPDDD